MFATTPRVIRCGGPIRVKVKTIISRFPRNPQHLKGLVTHQLSGKRLFIVDAFCGANADTRLSVRFITEVAWQAHFVKNMFIRPTDEELVGFKPDFIVMNGAKCTNPQWKEQGLNSENFVAFNLTERIQLIGGFGTAAK